MECACYDGPLSSADPSLVSMRCRDHQNVPPLNKHRWIRRDPILGELKMNEWYVNRRRYAIPKKRRAIQGGQAW